MERPTIFIHTTPNIQPTFFDIQDIRQIIGRTRSDVDVILFVDEKEFVGRSIEDTYNLQLLEVAKKNDVVSKSELSAGNIQTSELFKRFNCNITLLPTIKNPIGFSKPNNRQQFSFYQSHFTSKSLEVWYDYNNLENKKDYKDVLSSISTNSKKEFNNIERKMKKLSKLGTNVELNFEVDINKVYTFMKHNVINNINDDLVGSYQFSHVLRLFLYFYIIQEPKLLYLLTEKQPHIILFYILKEKKFFKRKSNDYLTLKTSLIDLPIKYLKIKKNDTNDFMNNIYQQICNVHYIKIHEIARYFDGAHFEKRNNKKRNDMILFPGIDNKILYSLLISPIKTLAKKVDKYPLINIDDVIKARREMKSSIRNIASLLAMGLKNFETIRIKNLDYREYSPVTTLSINLIKQYIPYDFVEIDMSQAYPTFVNEILGKNYINIYETLMTRMKITRSQAKVQYNMAINMWETKHEPHKKMVLDFIYTSDDVEKLMKYNTKSALFRVLSKLESQEYVRLRNFYKEKFEDIKIVRRHDSAILFSDNKNDILEYDREFINFSSKMKYKRNISFHRETIQIYDSVLIETIFTKILNKEERKDYIIKKIMKDDSRFIFNKLKYKGKKSMITNTYTISTSKIRKNKKIKKFISNFNLSMDYLIEIIKNKKTKKIELLWKN